jgi:hypothetical protein
MNKKEYAFADDKHFAENVSKRLDVFHSGVDGTSTILHGVKIKYNKHGFRSPDFIKNTDILFAGCSFTFGTGMPEDMLWTTMLAKENNLSYNTIGIPGGSCMNIVMNIFKYFNEYGHPKKILCLLPDFNRVYTYMDGKVVNKASSEQDDGFVYKGIFKDDPGHSMVNDEALKFLSLPTSPDKVYSKEFIYMLNSMYIKMLEIYCKSHNIPLIWFKWCEENYDRLGGLWYFSNRYIVDIKSELSVYTNTHHDKSFHDKCHQEERKILTNEPNLWIHAKDNGPQYPGHYGLHWHIHVKELFESALKEKSLI